MSHSDEKLLISSKEEIDNLLQNTAFWEVLELIRKEVDLDDRLLPLRGLLEKSTAAILLAEQMGNICGRRQTLERIQEILNVFRDD